MAFVTRRPLQSQANTTADWSFSTGVVVPGQCSQFAHCIRGSALASLVLRGHRAAQQTYGRNMRGAGANTSHVPIPAEKVFICIL